MIPIPNPVGVALKEGRTPNGVQKHKKTAIKQQFAGISRFGIGSMKEYFERAVRTPLGVRRSVENVIQEDFSAPRRGASLVLPTIKLDAPKPKGWYHGDANGSG